jgi:hypothetical protein
MTARATLPSERDPLMPSSLSDLVLTSFGAAELSCEFAGTTGSVACPTGWIVNGKAIATQG